MSNSGPQQDDQRAFDKDSNRGFTHVVNATRFSMQGLAAAFRHEAAFRQELGLTICLTPLAFVVGSTMLETSLLILVCLWVLTVELLNSGLESVVDRIGSEHHPLAGRAKDMGSAAVFISLVAAGSLWLVLILQNHVFA